MSDLRAFFGPNAGYVLELYERYYRGSSLSLRSGPGIFRSVSIRPSLTGRSPAAPATGQRRSAAAAADVSKIVGAAALAQAVREYGHLDASIDPLGSRSPGPGTRPRLSRHHRGGSRRAAGQVVSGPAAEGAANAAEAIADAAGNLFRLGRLRLRSHSGRGERLWLLNAVESGKFSAPLEIGHPARAAASPDRGRELRALPAPDLSRPEALLDRRQRHARADAGRDRSLRGRRRHPRGRDRDGPPRPPQCPDPCPRQAVRGDHRGVRRQEEVEGGRRRPVERQRSGRGLLRRREVPPRRPLAARRARHGGRGADGAGAEPEPPRSGQPGRRGHGPRLAGHHAINPASRVCDIQAQRGDRASTATPPSPARAWSPKRSTSPALRGYSTGGTIHIIVNNQVGFTTDPARFALDPLRQRSGQGLRDPGRPRQRRRSGSLPGGRAGWRSPTAQEFGKDFLIDLVGYRRWGHNEGDEPSSPSRRCTR